MNALKIRYYAVEVLAGLALTAWLILPSEAVGAAEEKFDVLRTRTVTYTNVTVTTKAKNYIFILHASGMASLKIAELSAEVQEQLGYAGSRSSTNTAAAWAKREIAKIDAPQVKALGQQLERKWRGSSRAALSPRGLIGPKLNWTVLGIVLLLGLSLHLFYSYCCMLICRKTGNPPGVLVWVPVLQFFPMLRAAGMSGWWFLAFFVPLLNLVPTILWPFKIAQARGKSIWVGVLLLLPVTNLFAFLYLAFSNGGPAQEEEDAEPKIMTLQTA